MHAVPTIASSLRAVPTLGVSVPFDDPALVLTAVFAVVLLGPVVAAFVRLPSIIALIAGGILIGPSGLGSPRGPRRPP